MPKRVFWPIAMVVVGAILIATKMGMLPMQLWNLWPIVLIVVGLGGLLISDKEEWDGEPKHTKKMPTKSAKKTSKRRK
ncbi:MAG: hypothetical protein BroJett025_09860 [Patescibacteria group bacterium]|nr:MAG: hypothetical protein BroJett025_09860 [Patescibacteria group bacterium]